MGSMVAIAERERDGVLEEGRAQSTSAAQACIAPLNLKEYNVVVVVVELQGVIHAEPYRHAVRVEHVTMSTRRVADAKVRGNTFPFKFRKMDPDVTQIRTTQAQKTRKMAASTGREYLVTFVDQTR